MYCSSCASRTTMWYAASLYKVKLYFSANKVVQRKSGGCSNSTIQYWHTEPAAPSGVWFNSLKYSTVFLPCSTILYTFTRAHSISLSKSVDFTYYYIVYYCSFSSHVKKWAVVKDQLILSWWCVYFPLSAAGCGCWLSAPLWKKRGAFAKWLRKKVGVFHQSLSYWLDCWYGQDLLCSVKYIKMNAVFLSCIKNNHRRCIQV